MLGRIAVSERNDLVSMSSEERTRSNEQGADLLIRQRAKAGIDLVFGAGVQNTEAFSGALHSPLQFAQYVSEAGEVRVHQTSYYSCARNQLLQNFQSIVIKSVENQFTPVMFWPGRFRLVTSPSFTGSPPTVNTIGIVAVALLSDNEEPVEA